MLSYIDPVHDFFHIDFVHDFVHIDSVHDFVHIYRFFDNDLHIDFVQIIDFEHFQ